MSPPMVGPGSPRGPLDLVFGLLDPVDWWQRMDTQVPNGDKSRFGGRG